MKSSSDYKKSGKNIIKNSSNKNLNEEIINKAFQFHSDGKIHEAAKYYQKLINEGCYDYRVFNNYGVILQGIGKLREAESSYKKAIKINPNFAEAYYNLAIILKDHGKLKEAEFSYRQVLKIDPLFVKAYSNLGSIFIDLGKFKEAETIIRKAIELDPTDANNYYNLGGIFKNIGKLKEAELSTRKAVQLNPKHAYAHLNLGWILKNVGKLKEAEKLTRKSIELKPNFSEAYTNLGSILMDLGKLKEAEISYCKALRIDPTSSKAYYALSIIQKLDDIKQWRHELFSKDLLYRKSKEEQIDIYFARANILHKEKSFEESSNCLELANKLKINIKPSNSQIIINKSDVLLKESIKKKIIKKETIKIPESIFIVGMPRSGSTLLESILGINKSVENLGETHLLEDCYIEWKKCSEKLTLAEIFHKKNITRNKKFNITTNKSLYNYQYVGIISSQIPNAKIIHCYRNPFDNILSIYRSHFEKGNDYASSLIDCANIYLKQEEIMSEYKKKFHSKIYEFNYDLLVSNPNKEIKSLINWLGWEWKESYLSPHLNNRVVQTRSNIQVRSPINSQSIGGWKNYKEMLKPAIEIITKNEKYKSLKF